MREALDPRKMVRLAFTAAVFGAFGLMFLPFWKPLLMAALFAFALVNWVDRLGNRRQRGLPALLILGGFSLVLVIPTLFVILRVVRSISSLRSDNVAQTSLYRSFEGLAAGWHRTLESVLAKAQLEVGDIPPPMEFFGKAAAWLVEQTTALAGNLPELILSLLVFAVALYFFLTEARRIRLFFIGLGVLDRDELDAIVRIVQRCSYRTLVASAAIGGVQALIVAGGALAFGYDEFMLIFILTFFASFIPVIGAAPIAALLALGSLAGGSLGAAAGLAVVAVVAGSVDNFLKPYFVSSGSDSDVHPVVALLAIIGAVIVYGIPGLLLGPILTELAVRIIPVFFHREPEVTAETDQTPPMAGP